MFMKKKMQEYDELKKELKKLRKINFYYCEMNNFLKNLKEI